ncbi:MAG: TGS domain-containing protein, partial [Oscillospiraceae bacterium]|nr:TGS domain-containing protein [Oscillospiraceae bacterium]
ISKDGIPFEVQIRTWEMHNTAEYGIAAHWKYKLGMTDGSQKESVKLNKSLEDLKKSLKAQIETEDATDLIKNIKNDFSQSDVFVFTPKGDIFTLPLGSTTVDLAYLIHTEVGHRMVGAKVNNKIVPIDYQLKTGEIVEIITQKDAHPNRNWLNICKTSSAKSKIRSWFKREKRDENIAEGKAELERELKRNGIHFSDEEAGEFFSKMLQKKHCNTMDDFYAAIGYGGIQLWKMMPRIKEEYQKKYVKEIEQVVPAQQMPPKRKKATSGVIIEGVDDVLIKFSQCCNPLPGDNIIGYITRGYGVSIHSRNCTNVPADISKCEEPERWINAYWEDDVKEAFRSTLEILAKDRTGLLADVTIYLSNMHIFIHSLNSREVGDGRAMVTATIEVNGLNHLKGVISKLSDISGIISITRK